MAYKYKAFISYAHADKAWARMLHLRLETFSTPKALVGKQGRHGEIKRNLHPIFRDRDELSTGSALGPELQNALEGSEFLLVLCSPASANSRWVNEEIRFFRKTHGDDRILAAIVDGDPAAPVGKGEAGCFPPALIEPPEGEASPREHIAADFRDIGDGKKLAFMKVASGLLGVGLDDLVQRAAQRRQRRMTQIAAASLAGMALTSGLAVVAVNQSIEANKQRAIAVEQRDTATASLDYLVSIFEIANPATENPNTITARTILDRGAEKLALELTDKPAVQAKLMGAMGNVYAQLDQKEEAETFLISATQSPALNNSDKASAFLDLAYFKYIQRDHETSTSYVDQALSIADTDGDRDSFTIEERHALKGRAYRIKAEIAAYGEFDKSKAVEFFEKARSEYVTAGADQSRNIAFVDNGLGQVFTFLGQFDKARNALSSAYAAYLNIYGEGHITTAKTLHNLALLEFEAGNPAEAAQVESQAVAIFEKVLDPPHSTLATAYLLQGRIENALGNFENAQTALTNAAEIFKGAYGPNHEMAAVATIYLAKYQAENGRVDASFTSLAEAKRIYDALYPPEHANHGDLLVYTAITFDAAGDKARAHDACTRGLAIMEKSAAGDPGWLSENREICRNLG